MKKNILVFFLLFFLSKEILSSQEKNNLRISRHFQNLENDPDGLRMYLQKNKQVFPKNKRKSSKRRVDIFDEKENTPILGLLDRNRFPNLDCLHLLIKANANLRAKNLNGETALHLASMHEDQGSALLLLMRTDAIKDLESETNAHFTPLMISSLSNRFASIVLLSRGANPFKTMPRSKKICLENLEAQASKDGLSRSKQIFRDLVRAYRLLYNGSKTGNQSMLREALEIFDLKETQSNINARDSNGDTAFHHAVRSGSLDAVSILSQKLNPSIPNKRKRLAIHLALDLRKYKILRYLIEVQGVAYLTEAQKNRLIEELDRQSQEEISELLKESRNLNDQNRLGETRLHKAAKQRSYLEVRELLKSGQNSNLQNHKQETALHIASRNGDYKTVLELLSDNYETDISLKNKKGETAFEVAFETLIKPKVKIQLARGKRASSVEGSPRNQNIYEKTIHPLLKAGSGGLLSDERKFSIYKEAIQRELKTIALFLKPLINFDFVDEEGTPILHKSTRNEDLETMRILIESGANTCAKTVSGETPFDIALQIKSDSALAVLTTPRCLEQMRDIKEKKRLEIIIKKRHRKQAGNIRKEAPINAKPKKTEEKSKKKSFKSRLIAFFKGKKPPK